MSEICARRRLHPLWLWSMVVLLLAGCDARQPTEPFTDAEVINWDVLMPPDWSPESYLKQLEAEGIDALGDEDPRAIALLDQLKAEWAKAPLVDGIDGRRVRLPGFVVPVEWGEQEMPGFLLVPYFGACIHTPPPPASQTVYVVMPAGEPYQGGLFDTVWVTGTIHALTDRSAQCHGLKPPGSTPGGIRA
ncbi:DUF3299 domain-containing protein [Thiorhodococcus minor]|uniref:DUF3299 domain-containing protein n=1 Tax=Thiorhodococcus minor TaxID=57489 RepID=A0A6M0K208_9GAMM|nr:DUF3299 domain-containing protein [Thiorhodococcus minor]NEV63419.1 DUF3299 domain-containing protein [Thiorhodococcus minor]